jgi:hypothetical protein
VSFQFSVFSFQSEKVSCPLSLVSCPWSVAAKQTIGHDGIALVFWIPAFAGMTAFQSGRPHTVEHLTLEADSR